MELRVERHWYSRRSTIGQLYVNGTMECYTMEPVTRAPGVKVAGTTAIPAGRYEVTIAYSQRFKRATPHVLDVPGFTQIEIHVGNFFNDTSGCTLLGATRGIDFIGHSDMAFDVFFHQLSAYLKNLDNKAWITYENLPLADSPLQPPLGDATATA